MPLTHWSRCKIWQPFGKSGSFRPTGPMAAPAPPGAPAPVPAIFLAAMTAWRGGVQPWGWNPALIPVLADFYGGCCTTTSSYPSCPRVHARVSPLDVSHPFCPYGCVVNRSQMSPLGGCSRERVLAATRRRLAGHHQLPSSSSTRACGGPLSHERPLRLGRGSDPDWTPSVHIFQLCR